jgi:hypothetical protein
VAVAIPPHIADIDAVDAHLAFGQPQKRGPVMMVVLLPVANDGDRLAGSAVKVTSLHLLVEFVCRQHINPTLPTISGTLRPAWTAPMALHPGC